MCTGILILSFGALSPNVGIGIVTDAFAQLSADNELTPSGTIANPSPEEIQMDTNGDGIVDENESQNQPVLTGNNLTTEEIQMDTNGDGIVDENESQNQPVLTGNNLPIGPKTGAQTFGGGTPHAKGCEGDLAIELPQARKTLEIADQNAGDFLRLRQAGGRHQTVPHYQFVLVCEIIFWYHLFRDPRLEECGAPSHGCPLHTNFLWAL